MEHRRTHAQDELGRLAAALVEWSGAGGELLVLALALTLFLLTCYAESERSPGRPAFGEQRE